MFRSHTKAAALMLALAAAPAAAEDAGVVRIGSDAYLGGTTVVQEAAGVDDLFMAGETATSAAAITGNAHIAGRRVRVTAGVGGDLYAAGMEVDLTAPVTGDATLAGYQVRVEGAVGADLRASGSSITVAAPVAGYAILAGETVRIDAVVTGDMHLAARDITFGPGARVDGTLTLYEDAARPITVPDTVAPADRITRVAKEEWSGKSLPEAKRPPSWTSVIRSFLSGVAAVAILAAVVAAILPEPLAAMRRRILAAPVRSVWFGFLALSAIIGSAVVLAMTVVGLIVMPAAILLALVASLAGYVLGAYSVGAGLMLAIRRDEPDTIIERAFAAAIGALVAGLVALIPLVGWLAVLALTLAGIGALTVRLFRPAFFAEEI
jgi:hypothetical protein